MSEASALIKYNCRELLLTRRPTIACTGVFGYAKDGRGRVLAANKEGKVEQYLEIWANKSRMTDVVSYVLVGGP